MGDNADLTVRIVTENPDAQVRVVGDQVIVATPADVGKAVVVDENGQLVLGEATGGGSGIHELNAQTGTTYTPDADDAGKIVTLTNAAAIVVTLPADATEPIEVGTEITFAWGGVGQPSFVLDAGAAWFGGASPTPGLKLRAVGSFGSAVKMAADTWALVGDLAA